MPGFRKGGFRKDGFRKDGFRRFNRGPRQMHKITCSECGNEGEVPFKPREGSEVLCKECFMKKKGITPREKKEEQKEESEEMEEESETPEEDFDEEEM